MLVVGRLPGYVSLLSLTISLHRLGCPTPSALDALKCESISASLFWCYFASFLLCLLKVVGMAAAWSSAITVLKLYAEALALAQSVHRTICVHRKEFEFSSELQHGFGVELGNIITFGGLLRHGGNNIADSNEPKFAMTEYLPYLKILRNLYDDYGQFVRLSECVAALIGQLEENGEYPQATIEGPEGTDTLSTSIWTIPGNFLSDYDWLWSPQKLQRLLIQSQSCTSKLLSCSPVVDADRSSTYNDFHHPELGTLWLEHSLNNSAPPGSSLIASGQPDHLLRELLLDGCRWSPSNISALHWEQLSSQNKQEPALVEYKQYNYGRDVKRLVSGRRRLFRLANQLKAIRDPSLLDFAGLVEVDRWKGQYALYFRCPRNLPDRGAKLTSLNSMIERRRGSSPSSEPNMRLKVATWLCKTLSRIHSSGLLHMNLSTSSVIFFRRKFGKLPESLALESPFLVDFEFARPVGDQTSCNFDPDLERDICRHPEHQGLPCESFDYEHDVYALGVVLLELGLWMRASQIIANHNSGEAPSEEISPVIIQNHLIDAAKQQLPTCMGIGFARIVVQCLRGEVGGGRYPAKYWAREVEKSLSDMSGPGKDEV